MTTKKWNVLSKLKKRKKQDNWDRHIASLRVGDYTTEGAKIVFKTHFLDKKKERIHLMVAINQRSKFEILRDDSSEGFYKFDKEFKNIKKAILEIIKMIKKECKLNHKKIKPWPRDY